MAIVAIAAPVVSAHRRDEYLQAARIGIGQDGVQIELDLTPGIALADVIGREIDRDGTGVISASEGAAYAALVLDAIRLDVDGAPLRLELVDSRFPTPGSMKGGEGTIRLELAATVPRLRVGRHELSYRNSHHPDIGVYLANALVPTDDRVAVTAQRRDVDQRELTIAFVLRADPPAGWSGWLFGGLASIVAALAVVRRRLTPASDLESPGRSA